MKKQYYNIIQPFIPSIAIGGAIIGMLLWLKPPFTLLLITLTSITILTSIRKGIKTILTNAATSILVLLTIHYLYKWLGAWGILGIILATILLTIGILIRRRKLYIKTIREIETIIWGKPNDRPKQRKPKSTQ